MAKGDPMMTGILNILRAGTGEKVTEDTSLRR
jgi:hypothetical protein